MKMSDFLEGFYEICDDVTRREAELINFSRLMHGDPDVDVEGADLEEIRVAVAKAVDKLNGSRITVGSIL